MVTYKFLTNTGYDVTVETDASDDHKTFFITDIQGLSRAEIEGGFNLGIGPYTESQFAQLALDKSLALYAYDEVRRERCLVIPGVAAGRFNGSTSKMTVGGLNFTVSPGQIPTNIYHEMTIRVTPDDVAKLNRFVYLSQNPGGSTVPSFYFRLTFVNPFRDNTGFNATFYPTIQGDGWSAGPGKSGFPITILANTCNTIAVRFQREGTLTQWEYYLNGALIETETYRLTSIGASTTPTSLDFGYGGIGGAESFSGIMRNIIMDIDGDRVIDIADPSDGTNAGSGQNGVPTDVESVTVII